ncbi:MAG: CDP-alcohol phosphatidyltransferase family protein [Planctomycetaceae bacterium]|nr:CDP-alcohol phosphatidyltransferase family protein [Planctomycetaceae bacterium]
MSAKNKEIIRHIPNALTVGRLFLTVIFLALIWMAARDPHEKPADLLLVAFILFVITGLTDIVDGFIARKYEVTSKFGRTVDPLADKFLVCGAFFLFAYVQQPRLSHLGLSVFWLHAIRWGTALILLAREIIVQTLRHIAESRGVQFGAIWSGKLKMFLQSFGIGTVLIGWAYVSRPWGDWFTVVTYALMIAITVFSGIQSITRRIR